MQKQYYIYITANKLNNVLYTGMTNNLLRRMDEHKNKLVRGFTERYNVNKLIYYEIFSDAYSAITREKQIKNLLRRKKIDLVKSINPDFKDLSDVL